MVFLTGIGQDSHRFEGDNKPLILGGVKFTNQKGLKANSDGDVILHSITNAISSITGKNILGDIADKMCQQGITDSSQYLKTALTDLLNLEYKIQHIAISIECLTPKITPKLDQIKEKISTFLKIKIQQVGITATTGEGLSDYGKGLGIFVTTIISVSKL